MQHGNLLLITLSVFVTLDKTYLNKHIENKYDSVIQIVLLLYSSSRIVDIVTTHHLLPSILCHKQPKESCLAMNDIFGNDSSPNIATIPSDNIGYANSQKLDSDAYDKKISENATDLVTHSNPQLNGDVAFINSLHLQILRNHSVISELGNHIILFILIM